MPLQAQAYGETHNGAVAEKRDGYFSILAKNRSGQGADITVKYNPNWADSGQPSNLRDNEIAHHLRKMVEGYARSITEELGVDVTINDGSLKDPSGRVTRTAYIEGPVDFEQLKQMLRDAEIGEPEPLDRLGNPVGRAGRATANRSSGSRIP